MLQFMLLYCRNSWDLAASVFVAPVHRGPSLQHIEYLGRSYISRRPSRLLLVCPSRNTRGKQSEYSVCTYKGNGERNRVLFSNDEEQRWLPLELLRFHRNIYGKSIGRDRASRLCYSSGYQERRCTGCVTLAFLGVTSVAEPEKLWEPDIWASSSCFECSKMR